jgi:hypothetical protein
MFVFWTFFDFIKWITKRFDKLEKKKNDCIRKNFPTFPKNLRAKNQSLFFNLFYKNQNIFI